MKAIFLDMDGVLNSDEYFDSIEGQKIDGIENEVDIEKVKLLKQAVDETGASVVITSSIRYKRLGSLLQELLNSYNMQTDLTPFLDNERGLEIRKWLEEHPETTDFVILDDEIFDSYDEELLSKLIKISNGNGISLGEGLLQKDVDEIIKRLGRRKKLELEDEERWNKKIRT